MSFTLSGTTITQSGTDTDLSGLSGIAGVTLNGRQYTLDGLRLEVNGNLTLNGFIERLRFINSPTTGINNSAAQIAVRAGATFTVEASRTINGGTVNRSLPVIDFGDFSIEFGNQSFSNNRRHLESDVGSTVNLSGVLTGNTSGTGLAYALDGTTNLTDVKIINQGTNQGSNQQVAFARGGDITILNCEIIGYSYTDRGGNYLSVNGISVFEDAEGFIWNNNVSTSPLYLEIDGYNADQISNNEWRTNVTKVGASGSVVNLVNCLKGNNISYFTGQGADREHRALITNVLNVTPLDTSFSSAAVKIWARDVDNGNRDIDFTPPGQSLIAASSDIIYEQTGSDVTFNILSGIFKPDQALDARGLSGGSDLAFKAIGYGFGISSFQPSLTGLGNKTSSPIMLEDTSITETTKATTDAYTELETSAKFYDRAKAYLVDNYAGETETIVSRTGDTIEARTYNVVIDATAASAFAFDGATITIKATAFTGNITTTGTVTLSNGASVVGTIIDSTADSALTFSGIDSWIVYANATDRDANTNALGSGLGAENYRFNFVTSTTYYLRLSVGLDTIFKTVTPTVAGETEVSLTTAGLLTVLPTLVDAAVTSSVDGIDLPSAISSGVETAILDDNDGQAVITAIVNAIGNTNIDEVALVGAIRSDLERSGGVIDNILEDTNELQTNQGNFVTATGFSTATDITTAQNNIITEINANETKIDALTTNVSNLNNFDPTTDQVIVGTNNDKTDYELANGAITSNKIANNTFNNSAFTTGYYNSINSEVDTALSDYDAPTKAELDTAEANIIAEINANETKIDSIISSITAGLTLTAQERNEIATAVEAAIINEGDGQQVIDAIVQAIGNENITASTIASAVWSDTNTYTGTEKGKVLQDAKNKANLASALSA